MFDSSEGIREIREAGRRIASFLPILTLCCRVTYDPYGYGHPGSHKKKKIGIYIYIYIYIMKNYENTCFYMFSLYMLVCLLCFSYNVVYFPVISRKPTCGCQQRS